MGAQRHAAVQLDAWNGSDPLTWRQVLQFEPEDTEAMWRVVELYSRRGTPFEARIAWSGGRGAGPEARLSVPTSTRVSLLCRTCAVFVANLSSADATVGVTIGDADAIARWDNFYVSRHAAAASPVAVTVPNYASRVRLEAADSNIYSSSLIETFDAAGVKHGSIAGNQQLVAGVPLGDADQIKVTCNAAHRLIWTLQL